MTNIQLSLFGGQVVPPDKKNNGAGRHNGREIYAIAKQILRELKSEKKETQQAIVCEMYYLTICEKLDLFPRALSRGLVVKLMERYFIYE